MGNGLSSRWTIAPSSDDALEPLVERLRELCLVDVAVLGHGGSAAPRELVDAFVDDLNQAVDEAQQTVANLIATPTAHSPAGLRLRADRLADAARIERLTARVLERLRSLQEP
ncbi:MAG: hypothetical protein KC503_16785 [Myxococcales bacterium]|nr:hypothetical protein [Myxococcales bacterium]